MTVAELIAELSKLDQSAVVCTRHGDETDAQVRIINGWSADRRASLDSYHESGEVADLVPLDAPHNCNDFDVILIG